MTLVERALLFGGRFGREGGDERQAERREPRVQIPEEICVAFGQLRAEIFKIHIHSGVARLLHPGDHGVGQRLLQGRILQQDGRLRGGEDAVLRQRGQVEVRLHAVCRRERQKRLILHGDERALQCKPVCKGREDAGIRQNPAQNGRLDIGIGVAAHDGGARLRLLEPCDEDLAGVDLVGAGKIRVQPVKLQDALAGSGRDGKKRVARLHLHGSFRPEDKQALPGHEPVRLPQAVIPGEKARRKPDGPADRIQRIAWLHDDDLHKDHLHPVSVCEDGRLCSGPVCAINIGEIGKNKEEPPWK